MRSPSPVVMSGLTHGFLLLALFALAFLWQVEQGTRERLQQELDAARAAHVQHVIDITKCQDDVGKLMKANSERRLNDVFK